MDLDVVWEDLDFEEGPASLGDGSGLDTGRLFRGRWPRPGLRLAFNA